MPWQMVTRSQENIIPNLVYDTRKAGRQPHTAMILSTRLNSGSLFIQAETMSTGQKKRQSGCTAL